MWRSVDHPFHFISDFMSVGHGSGAYFVGFSMVKIFLVRCYWTSLIMRDIRVPMELAYFLLKLYLGSGD